MKNDFKVLSVLQGFNIICILRLSEIYGVTPILTFLMYLSIVSGVIALINAYTKEKKIEQYKPICKMSEEEICLMYKKQLLNKRREMYYASTKNQPKMQQKTCSNKRELQGRVYSK